MCMYMCMRHMVRDQLCKNQVLFTNKNKIRQYNSDSDKLTVPT